MTVHAYLYLIGLIIGGGMIVYGLIRQVSQDRRANRREKLGKIQKSADVVQTY